MRNTPTLEHVTDGGFDGTAADIPFTPAGSIGATNTQAAIVELDAELHAELGAGLTSLAAGMMPFATVAAAAAYSPAAAPLFIVTAFYDAAQIVGSGATYRKVASQPSHAGKFSITLSGGGGTVWYELAEAQPTPQMFGAKGDGATDDTTAFTRLLAYSPACFWPAGSYVITTLAIPANARIRTAGKSTVIRQKSGQAVGTRIITIATSNVEFALDGIRFVGNISTDTNEQQHAILIQGDLKNVKVGDVLAEDIRGDAVYIGGTAVLPVYGISVGNVVGNNILRNVISITGGQQIDFGHVSGSAVGLTMFDVEPNTNSQYCDLIYARSVRGHTVGVFGLLSQKGSRVGRVEFGQLDLSPSLTADSAPAYGYRATITLDGVGLRNAESIRIGQYRARDFNRSPVFVTWNAGEYGVGDLFIGSVDFEGCMLTDTTYRSHIVTGGVVRNLHVGGGHYRVSDATHRFALGDGGGVNSTSKVYPNVDITVVGNGILGYGLLKGRVRAKVHPAAGRVLHTVVRASTADVTISTLANGSTIDGSTVATNDIVLLKDQTAGAENGLYRVNAAGPATRYIGADASAEFVESYAYVTAGTANAGKYFSCTNASAPTLGATAITYAEEVPYDAYAFNNCRDLTVIDSDITLGRAGLDCINFTIIGTVWRCTHASIIWNQSALSSGALHVLQNSSFVTLALVSTPWTFGTYSRDYRQTLKFGGNEYWSDSSNRLRVKASAPTSDTDGTVVGTQT